MGEKYFIGGNTNRQDFKFEKSGHSLKFSVQNDSKIPNLMINFGQKS
jgi:hypothetical protein